MIRVDTSKGRAAIVIKAMGEVAAKVHEVGGDDLGPKVEEYQRLVGLYPGSPWCGGFVTWCVTHGLGLPKRPKWASNGGMAVGGWIGALTALKKAGMHDYYVTALSGQESKVKPGWVFAQGRDEEMGALARSGVLTKGHTGIIVGLDPKDPDTFISAEGNTDSSGSALGIGVYEKRRKFSNPKMAGFYDPVAATIATLKPEELAALEVGQGIDFASIIKDETAPGSAVASAGGASKPGGGGGLLKLAAAAAGIYFITKA
jgi:hypothetical protein